MTKENPDMKITTKTAEEIAEMMKDAPRRVTTKFVEGVEYEFVSEGNTTTMRPTGKTMEISADRIVNMTTGRTSCCDSFSTIGQDDGVEYCKKCGCDITGYDADDAADLFAPTQITIQLKEI
jgi:hypothetical protein